MRHCWSLLLLSALVGPNAALRAAERATDDVPLTAGPAAASGAGIELDLAAEIRPWPPAARFADDAWYIWCGSMVRGDDGKYHLFYSRWPRNLGHNAWVTHSEIAHAVADSPLGPYHHHDVTLPRRGPQFWDGLCTHNPTIQHWNGKYYLYYMGNTGDDQATKSLNWTHRNNQRIGVAVADRPEGPWRRSDRPLIDVTPGFYDALCTTNPSITRRPDGGFLMVYKAVGDKGKPPFGGPVVHIAATSDIPEGPFKKHPTPVFTKEGVMFPAEDPFIWHQAGRYRAVVKDNAGHFTGQGKSLVLFESVDGLDWKLAAHPLVTTTELATTEGGRKKFYSLERPQLYLENGLPRVLFCAADESPKREHSFNVHIPLGGSNDKPGSGTADARP